MSDHIENAIADTIAEELSLGGDAKSVASAVMEMFKDDRNAIVELPEVAHKGPHDTDAMFFRQVAERLEEGRGADLGGSNVRRAVRDLLYRAADAAEAYR